MTFQELSVLFFNFFVSLKLFQNKKLRRRGKEETADYSVQFSLSPVRGVILPTKLLVWVPAMDFPHLMDFITFSISDNTI